MLKKNEIRAITIHFVLTVLVLVILNLLIACESSPANEQTQEQKTEISPELTIEPQGEVGGDVVTEVVTENKTSQDQVASSGAVVEAKNVDKIETETVNNEGEQWWVWLLVGFLIPMPRFIRWFF